MEEQLVKKPIRYTVHLQSIDGFIPIFGGEDKAIKEFMAFWSYFRPLSIIAIRYLNTMEGITVAYQGEARGYERTVSTS